VLPEEAGEGGPSELSGVAVHGKCPARAFLHDTARYIYLAVATPTGQTVAFISQGIYTLREWFG
jgi:hypothetical protein